MVIGKAHKDNLYLGITLFIMVLAATIVVAIGLLIDGNTIYNIIFSIVFWIFALTTLIVGIIAITMQLLTKDEIIIYNKDNDSFIINHYKKQLIININDIREINYNNRGLSSLGPFIFRMEYHYGKIIFIFNDGNKMKTSDIDNILEVYEELNELIINKG